MKYIRKCLWCGKVFFKLCSQVRNSRDGRFCRKGCASSYRLYKGGLSIKNGYMLSKKPEHPNADYHGYVRRAHLLMEESIGRFISPSENVHHINGDRMDDRIENLELFTRSEHSRLHALAGDVGFLARR